MIIKNENLLIAEAMDRWLARFPNDIAGKARNNDRWATVLIERDGNDPRLNTTPISAEQLAFDIAALDRINEMFADRRNR